MGLNHPSEATIHLAPSHSALCLSFSICRRQKSQERFCWRLQVTLRKVGPTSWRGEQNPWHIKAGLSQELVSSSIVDELLELLVVTAQAQEAQQQTRQSQLTTGSDCASPTGRGPT